MTGVVLLDKPFEMGSNEALQIVKRLFRARKAGHTGSLDRRASGLLPICLGEATKLSGFLLNADKRYLATFQLGITTKTGDAEGEVTGTRPVGPLDEARVQGAMAHFRGEIEQTPPMYSAIKHKGKRLYELAHAGIEVPRKPRPISIYQFDLLRITDETLDVEVHCSKGTYIRTLAEDLGAMLGCGAHVAALRRTAAGPYREDGMVTLEFLRALATEAPARLDEILLPMESALSNWPSVSLTEGVAFYLRKGQPVLVPHAPTSGWVRLFTEPEGFLGVGEVLDDGRVAPRRLLRGARK